MRQLYYDDDYYQPRRLCNSTAAVAAAAACPTVVRRSYCERHRKLLFDDSREQSPRSSERRSQSYEFSEDESLVNSLKSSTCSRSSFERRLVESPNTTSCLKSLTPGRTRSMKKRVNFAEEKAAVAASGSAAVSSSYAATSLNSMTRVQSTIPGNNKAMAIVRRRYANESAVASTSDRRTMTDYESTSDVMHSSTSALEALSLSSSNHCPAYPRIVRPRDVLRRPATRRMLVYPAEGQRGEPMTLSKKWSKIQCHVSGHEDTGFRYKVYYVQTFESDKWLPNNKTNSPFRPRDDSDNSTDYND